MYKNYITIALRNFWKDRNYALVNLIGLAVGFASVLMVVAYVRYELSYDTTYSNAPNVYRLVTVRNIFGTKKESVSVPDPLGKTLLSEFPEVVAFTSFRKWGNEFKSSNNKTLNISSVTANPDFFKVFNLPFIYGNASSLHTLGSVAISETTAKKFFGNTNPVGLTLSNQYGGNQIVGGVFKDFPPNTHLGAVDAVFSDSVTTKTLNLRGYSSQPQYILLNKSSSMAHLQKLLPQLYKKYDFPDDVTLAFQPVQSIHLHSSIQDDTLINSDIKYVYIFSAIAFFILFIACINYMNLTTARSLQRTREVGVRKVMGAGRAQLALQFLSESFLFFGITIPFAIVLAKLLWPYFASLLQLQTVPIDLLDGQTILILLLISIVAGLLSGLYPAFFLSRLQPVNILKGGKSNISLGLRKSLIVLQFVISIVLIIATLVVQMQLRYVNQLNLGFNKEHLLVLPYASGETNAIEAFKQDLLSNKNISNVSIAGLNIGERYGGSSSMTSDADTTQEWNFAFIDADFDFIKTMQIPILEGRDFSPAYASDRLQPNEIEDSLQKIKGRLSGDEWMNIYSSQSMIITTKTAELIKLPKPYSGQVVKLGALQGTVIGIIDDFKGMSLKQKNPAIVLRADQSEFGNPYVRINPNNIQKTLSNIETIWKKHYPGKSFTFSFVDEKIQSLYDSEQRLAKFFGIFAALGIAIACSGLFSLVALIVQQRTKEIGIRKVLGAGIKNIVQLLSADFIKLVIISIVIASPIAWWAMNKWLQDYESRIQISWWIFIIAGIVAIVIALATVSFQAIKAAMMNPVKSLRTE